MRKIRDTKSILTTSWEANKTPQLQGLEKAEANDIRNEKEPASSDPANSKPHFVLEARNVNVI